ncbi:MAG: ribosome silencing factor [Actinomycetia bacterium]|nr:ribosome silencing factor [Actinomycetes bacterium]
MSYKKSPLHAIKAAKAADDKKALNILVLDVSGRLIITDYFVICSGQTDRQIKSISDEIQKRLKENDILPLRIEGSAVGGWVLLDYYDFVVHIFNIELRNYYKLERLWRDAPNISWNSQ